MNGWSSQRGDDRWGDEPAWVYEITWEWEPQSPGQRYPGDPGRRKAVHTPVYEASHAPGQESDSASGRASQESRGPSQGDRAFESRPAQGWESQGHPQRGGSVPPQQQREEPGDEQWGIASHNQLPEKPKLCWNCHRSRFTRTESINDISFGEAKVIEEGLLRSHDKKIEKPGESHEKTCPEDKSFLPAPRPTRQAHRWTAGRKTVDEPALHG